VGTFVNTADFRSSGGYTIVEVRGIRIAIVAFTKGVDNLGLPDGSQNCVNLLYEDYTTDYKKIDTTGINKILRNIREEQPDLTIAMLHWGSEFNEDVSSSQKKIANLMLEGGVDVVLGSHSHFLQTIDYHEEEGTLVAYSLGDFYGDATTPGSNYSLILDLEISRNNLTGETLVSGYEYTPIYTLRPEQSAAGGLRVVRIDAALARYQSNYLGKITDDTSEAMIYALKRIGERIVQDLN
jgi:poly-gamma-glutamate synthesis protein (capsule biosynthesis protein)